MTELEMKREKEQQKILQLKAQNQALSIELTAATDKVKFILSRLLRQYRTPSTSYILCTKNLLINSR